MILFLVGDKIENILGHFADSLDKLDLARIAFLDPGHELFEINVIADCHNISPSDAKSANLQATRT